MVVITIQIKSQKEAKQPSLGLVILRLEVLIKLVVEVHGLQMGQMAHKGVLVAKDGLIF